MNVEVVPLRLALPEGTRILPEECGFLLPDGRFLRLYEYGVQEEESDGTPVRGYDATRPQHIALRCRIGGNPHGYGPHGWTEYETAQAVEVVLPETLAWMDDAGLVELAHLIHRKVVELEMTIDVVGDDVAEIVADEHGPDASFTHLIDLTTAGPYGGRPLP
jgi:hypothetical protein